MSFHTIIHSIIIIAVGVAFYFVVLLALGHGHKLIAKNNKNRQATDTYYSLIRSAFQIFFVTILILAVLQVNGVNVTSIVAGLGVVGVVMGLALQDALKDIIRGLTIVAEGYFKVDDVVTINQETGVVQSVGLKTTKIKSIEDDGIISFANRDIDQAEIVSSSIYLPIPMPINIPISEAEKAMKEVVSATSKLDKINSSEYRGATEITNSSINYMLFVTCDPINQLQARRDALTTALKTLEKLNIRVPDYQVDFHESKK